MNLYDRLEEMALLRSTANYGDICMNQRGYSNPNYSDPEAR